jgi:long-chain acyl-CoA synthetase
VVCVGLPHDEMGERLVAVVQLAPGAVADAQSLAAWCRETLAGYKCPKEFRFVDEIERNAMGKIDKRVLRVGLLAEP